MLDLSTGPKKTIFISMVAVSLVAMVVIVDLITAVPFRRSVGFDIAFLLSALCVATMAYETWLDFEPRRKQVKLRTLRHKDNSNVGNSELPRLPIPSQQPNWSRGSQSFDVKPPWRRSSSRIVSSEGAEHEYQKSRVHS